MSRLSADTRGTSVTINYILGLTIAFLLVTGILITAGNFVKDQRETSVRTEMEVLGEQIAADISMADRMVQSTSTDVSVAVDRTLPDRISGESYTIEIKGGDDPSLKLHTDDPSISVDVEFTNVTAIEMSRIDGGSITVRYTGSDTLALEERD